MGQAVFKSRSATQPSRKVPPKFMANVSRISSHSDGGCHSPAWREQTKEGSTKFRTTSAAAALSTSEDQKIS